jgi:DNA-binding transcriptional LysR family regulator
MNLRDLECFVALAEELNFSRAAERLHVAQPALSQQIKRLESHLKAELVDRAQRPLRLTEAGSYFLTEARHILAAAEQASRGAHEIALGKRGWLAIGFTRSSIYSVLPPALSTFHRKYPQVELKLFEMITEEQEDALQHGRIHVGIGRQPVAAPGFTNRTLLREQIIAVLPPDHPAARSDAPGIAELAETPLILFPKPPTASFARLIEDTYRAAGVPPRVEHRTYEIQTALALVAAGLGVTFVGESVARHGRADVVFRRVQEFEPIVTTLAATFQSDDESPHLHAFLGCLPTG